ncbi:MAG: Ig-like domain-containing protein [Burkholderiaceae bacterium]
MALVIEAIDANGVVTRTAVEPGSPLAIQAEPGILYRITDDSGRPIGAGPRAIRLDGDLVIDNLPGSEKVVIENFFTACTPDTPCRLSLEDIGGGINEAITPASEPIAALTDGGYLMNSTGSAAPLPIEPGTELNWKPIAAGAAGLLVVAGAAGGGGGGGADTTAPVDPTLTTTNVGSGTPILAGTAEAGSRVVVGIDVGAGGNLVTYQVTADQAGAWSLDLATATPLSGSLPAGGLPAGVSSPVSLQSRDSAGNLSGLVSETVVFDNTPPAAIAIITGADDDASPVTGPLASGGVTNDTSPTLAGSLSAALASDESVQVLRNGVVVGQATVSGLTWAFTDANLADGSYAYSVRTIDASGNANGESTAFSIVVATNAPSTTAVITDIADNLPPGVGSIASGGLTNDGTPVLSGTVSAALAGGDVVQVLRDGVVAGEANVTGTNWTFQEVALPDGTYAYTVQVADAAGNSGAASPAYSIIIDSTNPDAAATIINAVDNTAPVTGVLQNADVTNDTTPELNGSLNEALAPGESVQILRDGAVVGTATINPTNNLAWSFQETGLGDGTYAYTARTIDAAGNTSSPSGTFQLVVDATPPAAVVAINSATDNIGTVTSLLSSGDPTDDTRPRLNGNLSTPLAAGETLEVSLDSTVVASLTPAGTTWTYTATPALAEGTYQYTAQVVDGAGNTSNAATFDVVIDLTAPAQAVTIVSATDNVGGVTGSLATGDTTDDTQPALVGTVGAGLAATDSIEILLDGTVIGLATRTGTNWTFTPPTAIADGNRVFSARVIDAAGNPGTADTFNLTIDTTGPATTATILSAVDSVTPLTAALGDGDTTNDTTPVLQGSLSAALATGQAVEISRDTIGVANSTVVDTATIAVGASAWTYTPSPVLANGQTYLYTARVVDAIGNPGTDSAPFELSIDTIAPTATVSITNPDAQTADTTPAITGAITGTLAANEVVQVFRGAVLVGEATVTGSTWSVVDTPALAEGQYNYTARVVDAAGNLGTASTVFALTVDTTDPTATAAITNTVNDTADSTPAITGSVTGVLAAGEVVEVLRDSVVVGEATVTGATWSFVDTPALADDTYVYQAQVSDLAGNSSALSPAFSLTIDTVDPAATADITGVNDNVPATIGVIADGDPTNDPSPEIEITLDALLAAGETIEVSRDGAVVGTATGSGLAYTFTDAGLTVGTYVYSAEVVDLAGNTGPAGVDYTIDFVNDPLAVGQDNSTNSGGAGGTTLSINDLFDINNGTELAVDTGGVFSSTTSDPFDINSLGLNQPGTGTI